MAGELGDVAGGDAITAGFTNAVKDRTVMRYASASERDSLIPSPTAGDVAWLDDVSGLTIHTGTHWANVPRTDINGNLNFGSSDLLTSGMFIGTGAMRNLFIYDSSLLMDPGPDRQTEVVALSGFTTTSKMAVALSGSADNGQTLRGTLSYYDLSTSSITVSGWVPPESTAAGSLFYRLSIVEYY